MENKRFSIKEEKKKKGGRRHEPASWQVYLARMRRDRREGCLLLEQRPKKLREWWRIPWAQRERSRIWVDSTSKNESQVLKYVGEFFTKLWTETRRTFFLSLYIRSVRSRWYSSFVIDVVCCQCVARGSYLNGLRWIRKVYLRQWKPDRRKGSKLLMFVRPKMLIERERERESAG